MAYKNKKDLAAYNTKYFKERYKNDKEFRERHKAEARQRYYERKRDAYKRAIQYAFDLMSLMKDGKLTADEVIEMFSEAFKVIDRRK